MLFKLSSLKNIANLPRKTPVLESLFKIVAGPEASSFIKKRLHNVFSCKICEIFLQNTSGGYFLNNQNKNLFKEFLALSLTHNKSLTILLRLITALQICFYN